MNAKTTVKKYILLWPFITAALALFALVALAKVLYNTAQESAALRTAGQPNKFWDLLTSNLRYMVSFTDLQ
jgi:hypothetical protein